MHNPKDLERLAEKGESIYQEKYKDECERDHMGRFVAINTENGEAFIADDGLDALRALDAKCPNAPGHMVRVGHQGVTSIGFSDNARERMEGAL